MYIYERKQSNEDKIIEDSLVIEMMNNLSKDVLENNIINLCKAIASDEYAKNLPSSFSADNIDIHSDSDINKIYKLIKEVIDKAIYLLTIKNKIGEVNMDPFEYKLTKSEENIQDEIDKYNENDPHIEELIDNFIAKDSDNDDSRLDNINNNIIQNFVESLLVKEKNKQSLSSSFRTTLENIVLNNILSSMIQSNCSEYIYKFNIDPDKFHTFKNYDLNYSLSSKSLKVTDDEFNTE